MLPASSRSRAAPNASPRSQARWGRSRPLKAPRKGERVVLLTTQKGADRAAMQREAKAKGASELSVPGSVLVVEKVPLLGSGKTDYVAATAMAREIASAPEQDVA